MVNMGHSSFPSIIRTFHCSLLLHTLNPQHCVGSLAHSRLPKTVALKEYFGDVGVNLMSFPTAYRMVLPSHFVWLLRTYMNYFLYTIHICLGDATCASHLRGLPPSTYGSYQSPCFDMGNPNRTVPYPFQLRKLARHWISNRKFVYNKSIYQVCI